MLVFIKHPPCSCGGVLVRLSWRQHVLFNMFFLLVCGSGIVLERKHRCQQL
jgi:hypothetical protein